MGEMETISEGGNGDLQGKSDVRTVKTGQRSRVQREDAKKKERAAWVGRRPFLLGGSSYHLVERSRSTCRKLPPAVQRSLSEPAFPHL